MHIFSEKKTKVIPISPRSPKTHVSDSSGRNRRNSTGTIFSLRLALRFGTRWLFSTGPEQKTPSSKSNLFMKTFFAKTQEARDKLVMTHLENRITEIFEDESSIFHLFLKDDLPNLQQKLLFDKSLILARDPIGALVVHYAYLYNKTPEREQIRRWLVTNFPEECISVYSRKSEYSLDLDPDFDLPYEGENILHICIVHRDLDEIRWLIQFYKNRYMSDGMPCLATLLDARACGTFFHYGKACYFGEFPLFFAVCSNDKQIVDALLEVSPWDAIFWTDSHGNTALHLCVIHDLQEMYTYIESVAKKKLTEYWSNILETKDKLRRESHHLGYTSHAHSIFNDDVNDSKNDGRVSGLSQADYVENLSGEELEKKVISELHRRLIRKRNNNKHSVITLAASKDASVSMFKFLLEHKKSIRWIYGHIKAIYIDMTDLESIDADERNNGVYGAIEWLCRDEQYDKIAIPEITSIIQIKWNRIGIVDFVTAGCWSLFLAILITILALVENLPWSEDQYNNHYMVDSPFGGNTNTTNTNGQSDFISPEPLSLSKIKAIAAIYAIIGIFLIMERGYMVYCVLKYKIDYFGIDGGVRGAAQFDRICSTLQFFLFIGVCVGKYTDHLFNSKVVLCVVCLLAWGRQYFFLMGFASTGRLVLIISRMIKTDFVNFLQFFGVILFAFGSAFSLLSHIAPEHSTDLENYASSVWYTLLFTLDNNLGNMAQHARGQYQSFAVVYYTVYLVLVNYLMFSMLIAMMNGTFKRFYYDSSHYLSCEKYNIMCSLESARSTKELEEIQAKYTMKKVATEETAYFAYEEVQSTWWNISRNNARSLKQEKFNQVDEKMKALTKAYNCYKKLQFGES